MGPGNRGSAPSESCPCLDGVMAQNDLALKSNGNILEIKGVIYMGHRYIIDLYIDLYMGVSENRLNPF